MLSECVESPHEPTLTWDQPMCAIAACSFSYWFHEGEKGDPSCVFRPETPFLSAQAKGLGNERRTVSRRFANTPDNNWSITRRIRSRTNCAIGCGVTKSNGMNGTCGIDARTALSGPNRGQHAVPRPSTWADRSGFSGRSFSRPILTEVELICLECFFACPANWKVYHTFKTNHPDQNAPRTTPSLPRRRG
jgi:hypothetical protein